jgi:hypothetical protein
MLEFFKRLFGPKPADTTTAPYKVEVIKPAESEKKPVVKKPAAKKSSTRKPRKPAAPKA